ncbi:hypothetical protein, partial [Salmonella sp. SAL4358]|uniref:hypothetical protein n=1 Tax=Salmonella sp. SAL4358 TaxID=3159879 RepID=UPI00397A3DC0
LYAGDERGVATFEEAVRVAREGRIDGALVFALPHLGTALAVHAPDRAVAFLDEAIDVARRIGDTMAFGTALGMRAMVAAHLGQPEMALMMIM